MRLRQEYQATVCVVVFRDARAQDAPRHVRNEMACLSAAMAYAVESGKVGANPCQEVKRPRKRRRERLITHDEYLAVWEVASPPVRRAMALAIRTLALPADVLTMGPREIVRLANGERILRFARGKTGIRVEVELVGEFAAVIDEAFAEKVVCPAFIHRRDGKPNTRDGIAAMFRRHCVEAKVTDFGLSHLRAKGATEMFRGKIPIRTIQLLLGHASVQTTEIYLKQLIPQSVRPNETAMVASVK